MTGTSPSLVKEVITNNFQGFRDWSESPLIHKAYVLPYIGRFEIKEAKLRELIDVITQGRIESTTGEEREDEEKRQTYFKKVQKEQNEYNNRFADRSAKFREWAAEHLNINKKEDE